MRLLLRRSCQGETGAEIFFPALAEGSMAGGRVGA